MNIQNHQRITLLSRMGILAVTATLASATWAGNGRCFRAEVPDTMTLPDGQTYEAGSLTICMSAELNPVAGLHETSVDGRTIGLFRSRIDRPEVGSTAEGAVIVFSRGPSGGLVLEGYEIATGASTVSYRLAPRPEVRSRWELQTRGDGAEVGSPELVLIAAR